MEYKKYSEEELKEISLKILVLVSSEKYIKSEFIYQQHNMILQILGLPLLKN